ncbi:MULTISPECIES: UPF0182 family protein [unclassified Fusibacter]|uniref:UPF0182 family membrane protein n=1 Tax=unclassified Fusibacter TaxID=2624464 RepID=UPI0010105373|nr:MULTISPECIES: UPF0182 family protein [unclassified Fusibacter]MCK8061364.1 UPF0182 family protein [Fusibacter sp. A2]NPE23593.1 COG1615 family transporter [Fusibacter sp. A1]RXV59002.1 UPF0182 family protein [Fusibacter sp. A1]
MNKRQRLFSIIIGIAVLLMIFSRTIIDFFIDYQWFSDLGFTDTFLVKLFAYLKIGLPLWIITAVGFSIYFIWVEKQYFRLVHVLVDVKNRQNKSYKKSSVVAATLLTLLLSIMVTSNMWFDILKYFNATSFGSTDPLFNTDIGFYVFKLPLYNQLLGYSVMYIIILAIATVLINVFLMGVKPPTDIDFTEFQNVHTIGDLKGFARKGIIQSLIIKLGVFGVMVFLLLAVHYWLEGYQLLYSTRGVAYGASYTDITISLLGYRVQAVVSLLGAITFLIGLLRKKYKMMLSGPALLFIVSFGFGVVSLFVQNFIVEPDEISKEREFLEYNIAYTQEAFNLGVIDELEYPVTTDLTLDTLEQNKEVIDNIRINDYRPLKQTYNQIQGIRLYYEFSDIDVDRYYLDGSYTQVFLSAREMNLEKLQVQTWQNRHIKFTHGYGVALSPVNSVNTNGQPELLIKNIPPVSSTSIEITQPEIYFGELTNDYIIVGTSEKEFDYPKGSDNQETLYTGDAGLKMNFMNRVFFAVHEGDFRILVSSIIDSDSKIIIRRNIMERLRTIAPFMVYDDNPYIVVDDETGKLFWIVDAYTVSSEYPYSQPFDNSKTNYIRNSVKVVIDAYTGETNFYVFDDEDPIIKTYQQIFSDLYKQKSEFPTGLMAHIRYPKNLFRIQAEVFRKYHVTNPSVFYNGEDIWDIGTEIYMNANEAQAAEPNYAMFKIPEEEKLEFLLTLPYTPKDKPNMTSLFVARNDGDNYGKLFIYKFPKDRTITGPAMLESKIDQDSTISPQLTLWSQKGSAVLRGNILIVPIDGNLLYIEPIYLQADNQESLPEMKQVIVSYDDAIVMEETLDKALAKIFGSEYTVEDLKEEESISEIGDETLKMLMEEAFELYNSTQRELDDLKDVLERIEDALNGQEDAVEEETEPDSTPDENN